MPPRPPRLKIARRFGTALPGLTRKDHERRPTPPGQHGASASRRRKTSEYRRRLEEKQKVRFNYGVSERQLRRLFEIASGRPGRTGDILLALLESRLDNIVFRLGFAPTIPAARQLVVHGHVLVDGRRVDRPSYRPEPGQQIALAAKAREIPAVVESVTSGPRVRVPSFLALDPDDSCTGRVLSTPLRHDVSLVVNETAIVEFYAR